MEDILITISASEIIATKEPSFLDDHDHAMFVVPRTNHIDNVLLAKAFKHFDIKVRMEHDPGFFYYKTDLTREKLNKIIDFQRPD